jgi:hypothetical protein
MIVADGPSSVAESAGQILPQPRQGCCHRFDKSIQLLTPVCEYDSSGIDVFGPPASPKLADFRGGGVQDPLAEIGQI